MFWNILTQKFQNYTPRTGCLALCMYLFWNNYWCQKRCICLFLRLATNTHFPDYLQTLTSQIFLELEHTTLENIYECNTKSYLRRCILLNKIVFFFFDFLYSAYFSFVSSQMFGYALVFIPTDYIKIIMYWRKIKLAKLYICLKLTIRTPRGSLKFVQSENIWRCFCVSIDNFEQVSQIIVIRLWPTSSIFCMQNIPFYSVLFL